MKYAAAAVVSSLLFVSGSAFAEGCAYGYHSDVVADGAEVLESAVEPLQDPKLLAFLKPQDEQVQSDPIELK